MVECSITRLQLYPLNVYRILQFCFYGELIVCRSQIEAVSLGDTGSLSSVCILERHHVKI